jgi:hypothetical protein
MCHHRLMQFDFGDVPTWVAAVGTAGALGAALAQIHSERNHRISQEAADRTERHESQARLIAAWAGKGIRPKKLPSDGYTPIYLINSSQEPVYELVVCVVAIQGAAPRCVEDLLKYREERAGSHGELSQIPLTTLSILPPGKWATTVSGSDWDGHMSGRNGVDIAFTDRSGSHWVRRALGRLEELDSSPLDYFQKSGLFGPHDLRSPDPSSI